MAKKRIIAITSVLAVALVLILTARSSADASGSRVRVEQAPTCEQILAQALDTLHQTCDGLTRNQACYGNNAIQAEPAANVSLKFDTVGDTAPLRAIKSLSTSPLNLENGTWGLSLLKVQANLPDTLPGQNVIFLVYGDTSVQNTSGNMQSFYFSSGLGTINCTGAPDNAIVVTSPNHTEVTFNANGVQITIASTIVLKAAANQSMSVQLVEGHARVSTSEGTQTLQPGQEVNVPLGGDNGLQATGAPSLPHSAPADAGLGAMVSAAQGEINPAILVQNNQGTDIIQTTGTGPVTDTGNGTANGPTIGTGNGSGIGQTTGNGSSTGNGSTIGTGIGHGNGDDDDGNGHGNGNGNGNGHGNGNGNGNGNGHGNGHGNGNS